MREAFLQRLTQKGVPWRYSTKQDEVWICHGPGCVIHGERTGDTRFRLGVNLRDGKASCFNCRWKSYGDRTFEYLEMVFEVPQDKPRIPTVPEETVSKRTEEVEPPIPAEYLEFDSSIDELGQQAYRYLQGRGVTRQQIQQHEVGYAIGGRYGYRVIFPIHDEDKVVGVVARDWTGRQQPPYLFTHKLVKPLYNYSNQGTQELVVVEGVFDCLAVERAGYQAVAVLGRTLTEKQEEALGQFPNITVMVDWDGPGIESGLETVQKLVARDPSGGSSSQVKIARPPKGKKDAGEMTTEQIQAALDSARTYARGLEGVLKAEYELSIL